jgi:predicted PurR-regulated permease PerM
MKRLAFRKQLSIFAVCVLVLTVCAALSFLIDRFGFARGLFGNFLEILTPFVVGGIIAFILKPICNRLDEPIGNLFVKKLFRWRLESGRTTERRLRRSAERVSILAAMLLFFGIVFALLALVLPRLFESVVQLVTNVPDYLQRLTNWLLSVLGEDNPLLNDRLVEIMTDVNNYISEWLKTSALPLLENFFTGETGSFSNILAVLSGTINVGAALVGVILDTIVSIVVSIYILMSRKKFAEQGSMVIFSIFSEKWANRILEELRYTNRVFSRFITGRMLDSLLVGVLVFIVCSIVGIPQTLLVSVLVGASNMIPFFGPYLGTIPSALIILIIDPIKFIYFVVLVIIIQQIDSNILDPMVVGNAIDMSGFWVLFSVILCGGLFGFPGLLLGVPTFAVLYDIARKLIDFGLKKRGKTELMETYQGNYHDPCDDAGHLRQRARMIRREKKAARALAEAEKISRLVHEAQASGTTEAMAPDDLELLEDVFSSEEEEFSSPIGEGDAPASGTDDPTAPSSD